MLKLLNCGNKRKFQNNTYLGIYFIVSGLPLRSKISGASVMVNFLKHKRSDSRIGKGEKLSCSIKICFDFKRPNYYF